MLLATAALWGAGAASVFDLNVGRLLTVGVSHFSPLRCRGCVLARGLVATPAGDPAGPYAALTAAEGVERNGEPFASLESGAGPLLVSTPGKRFAGGWLAEGHLMLAEADGHPTDLAEGEAALYFYRGELWFARRTKAGIRASRLNASRLIAK